MNQERPDELYPPAHPTVARIEALLRAQGIAYEKFIHVPVRTSEEAARVRPGFSLAEGAKALLVRAAREKGERGAVVQLVVPGDARFAPRLARRALGAKRISFIEEEEVRALTGGVEPGGVPPFGTLWNIPVYCDRNLLLRRRIIFNAGDRRVSLALAPQEYVAVVRPHICDLVARDGEE